jgi:hypothetical protein
LPFSKENRGQCNTKDYGIVDPVGDAAVGEFTNPDLQTMYDLLIDQGSISLADALKVRAAIEEMDILDLRKWTDQTEKKPSSQFTQIWRTGLRIIFTPSPECYLNRAAKFTNRSILAAQITRRS